MAEAVDMVDNDTSHEPAPEDADVIRVSDLERRSIRAQASIEALRVVAEAKAATKQAIAETQIQANTTPPAQGVEPEAGKDE